jgi:hypothetical protein
MNATPPADRGPTQIYIEVEYVSTASVGNLSNALCVSARSVLAFGTDVCRRARRRAQKHLLRHYGAPQVLAVNRTQGWAKVVERRGCGLHNLDGPKQISEPGQFDNMLGRHDRPYQVRLRSSVYLI